MDARLVTNAAPAPQSAAKPGSSLHRADIDGLRAVAILPVMFYHVGLHLTRGGYVGVDVFFVISGYLISLVLITEIEQDRLSILGFYERRIRRILPALLFVLAVTTFVYLPLSLPSEFVDYSKTLIAAATSVSNVYFWLHAGYFDTPAASKPLLHTWSLAVEEQFYLFWPAYLYIAYRLWRRHVVLLTAMVATASLVISAFGAFHFPSATFYLLHTRAWELMLGGLLALGIIEAPLGALTRNALSIIGILLIAGSVLTMRPDLPFPGLLAIPPCLGAGLIILAGRDGTSLIGRLLSWRPIGFIGLISYSLYLWHWPIALFQKNYALLTTGHSDFVQKLAVIGASFVMATLSWKFVEQPFRSGPRRPSRAALLRFAVMGTAALIVLGIVGWSMGGFPSRYSEQELRIAAFLNYDSGRVFRGARCFLTNIDPEEEFAPECLAMAAGKPNYLLIGDSHAADLWYGLNATYGDINFLQATASDCFPTEAHGLGEWPRCVRLTDDIMHRFIASHHVDRVVIAARWRPELLPRIDATLDWFSKQRIPVTLIGPAVVYDAPVPRLLLIAARKGTPGLLDQHWDHSQNELDDQMAALARRKGVQYVSLLRLMCPDNACVTADNDGLPLLSDREHFTSDGSTLVARKLKSSGLWAQPQ